MHALAQDAARYLVSMANVDGGACSECLYIYIYAHVLNWRGRLERPRAALYNFVYRRYYKLINNFVYSDSSRLSSLLS